MARREYKSGSAWALWRWTDIVVDGELYLRRLHIIQIPIVGAIMLHWIKKPDSHPDLHDHPVSFLSIVLRGSYLEERFVGPPRDDIRALRLVRRFNIVSAKTAHRITNILGPRGVVTLVFAGPKANEWGFYTPAGWQHWRGYKENV